MVITVLETVGKQRSIRVLPAASVTEQYDSKLALVSRDMS